MKKGGALNFSNLVKSITIIFFVVYFSIFFLKTRSSSENVPYERISIEINLKNKLEYSEKITALISIDAAKSVNWKKITKSFRSDFELVEQASVKLKRGSSGVIHVPVKINKGFIDIDFPKLQVGDVVEYVFVVRRLQQSNRLGFYAIIDSMHFGNFEKISWKIIYPENLEIFNSKYLTPKSLIENKKKFLHFEIVNNKKLHFFNHSPSVDNTKIIVSSYKTYSDFGNDYHDIFQKNSLTYDVLPKIIKNSFSHYGNKESAVTELLFKWVQENIKYSNKNLDVYVGGPRDIESILSTKNGDCKDHVALLHALLKREGIESVPALVSTKKPTLWPEIVYPTVFDHLVLYVPSINRFIDPSDKSSGFNRVSPIIQGKPALLISDNSEIRIIP